MEMNLVVNTIYPHPNYHSSIRRKAQKVIDFVTGIYLKRVLPCIRFNGLD